MSIWIQAARVFSFTASLVPVLVGAALAISYDGAISWALLPLVIVCSVLFQAGTNLVSDYFDFKNGVDQNFTFGSSRVILDGVLTPKQVLVGGWILFGIGSLLGLVLVALRGLRMLVLGIIGLLGGCFYTGAPVGYKYVALGEALVFALMGPLMVSGSYFALTGNYDATVIYSSLPIGFLVAAILHANNLRDTVHDADAKVKTLANLLGYTAARVEYYALVSAAYAGIPVMAMARVISPWSLLVFLSLPLAVKNIRTIQNSQEGEVEKLALIDVQTAQLHSLFGLLFIFSIIVGALTS